MSSQGDTIKEFQQINHTVINHTVTTVTAARLAVSGSNLCLAELTRHTRRQILDIFFRSSMKKTAPAKRVITLIAGHGSQNSRRLNSPGKWRKGGRCTAQTR
jgi:hypothetical protein